MILHHVADKLDVIYREDEELIRAANEDDYDPVWEELVYGLKGPTSSSSSTLDNVRVSLPLRYGLPVSGQVLPEPRCVDVLLRSRARVFMPNFV